MRLIGWGIGFIAVIALMAALLPVIAPFFDGGQRNGYRRILLSHTYPQRWHNQTEFLYFSCFSKGDASETVVFPDGCVKSQQFIWDYGARGTDRQTENPITLNSLKSFPALPTGFSSPDQVDYKDLLIVSQLTSGHWNTMYYDRHHLPIQVQNLESLLKKLSPNQLLWRGLGNG